MMPEMNFRLFTILATKRIRPDIICRKRRSMEKLEEPIPCKRPLMANYMKQRTSYFT